MIEQEMKELNIFVNGLKREVELKKAIEFALKYMHKANEMGAFDGCVYSGNRAIEYLTKVIAA